MRIKLPSHTAETRFLIAVSGGVDSMCLLHALKQELPASQLAVAHYNHRTRGHESEEDALFVRAEADRLGIVFFSASRQQIGQASEDVLRDQRRAFLLKTAEEHRFDYICTAHHANDQLETILMRLVRGTDWRGMSGIRFENEQWVRPLLFTSRTEIEAYAKKQAIAFRVDHSNYQTHFFRNALRHGVVRDLLQVAENAGVSEESVLSNVGQWCERSSEVQDFLVEHTDKLLEKLVVRTRYWARISLEDWWEIPRSLQPFVLNRIAETLLGHTVCRKQLKLWRKHLKQEQKRFQLKEGIHVRVSMGYWYLLFDVSLESEQQIRHSGDQYLFDAIGAEITLNAPPAEYEVRYFRSGDRFVVGGKKLKEFFQKRRIPAPERKWIPVLAHRESSEILWCYGQEESFPPVTLRSCTFPFAAPLKPLRTKHLEQS